MLIHRRPWKQELQIIDRAMRAISGITDPEELVGVYWEHIGELIPIENYLSLSRRGEEPPNFLITRSTRFTESLNPWTQRHLLPRLSGGILGEIVYANEPVIINNLPDRLTPDDPGHFYLEGFQSLVALPQYDNNEGVNVTMMLLKPGDAIDDAIIPMLHWQSGLFGRGTQNLVLRNQLADTWAKLDEELKVVGRIQKSLLPQTLPPIDGVEVAAYYQTSARAGGDYYDFFPLQGGKWGLFIADVAGHGTPAAVLMAITHALAHSQPHRHTPPDVLLAQLNNQLTRSYTQGGTFVTAFYGVLDPADRTLTYANAGHNPPRLIRCGEASDAAGAIQCVDRGGGLPLGILEDQVYGRCDLRIAAGDLLLLYTDGITESFAPTVDGMPRELFGVERLDQVLLGCRSGSADACIERIKAALADFTGNTPPSDDQTLIAMRFR